jgi:hypothetical protein
MTLSIASLLSFEDLLLLPVLVGYAAYWGLQLRQGRAGSPWGIRAHIALYVALAFWIFASLTVVLARAAPSLQHASGFGLDVDLVWLFSFLISVPAAIVLGYRVARHRVHVLLGPGGTWTYRSAAGVVVAWSVIWAIRAVLEAALLGGYSLLVDPARGIAPPSSVPVPTLAAVALTIGLLYYTSSGMMIGFEIAILRAHRYGPVAGAVGPGSKDGTRLVH